MGLAALSAGHLAPIAATYRKRWYEGSAHDAWPPLLDDERLRVELLPAALRSAPPDARALALAHGWDEERRRLLAELDQLRGGDAPDPTP